MIKCTILIPDFDTGSFLDSILDLCGGYTIEHPVEGADVMQESGKVVYDKSIKLWTVCSEDVVPKLRDIAAKLACRLNQESIYFEVHEVYVEFVEPYK